MERLPPTSGRLLVTVEAEGATADFVVVTDIHGRRHCIASRCPHADGPLHLGDIEDGSIVCPWHGYRFSLSTGLEADDLGEGASEGALNARVIPVGEDGVLTLNPGERVVSVKKVVSEQQNTFKPAFTSSPSATSHVNPDDTLHAHCVRILTTPDPHLKVALTLSLDEKFSNGEILIIGSGPVPDEPARQPHLTIVAPGKTARRGNGGNAASRVAILHALANIEQWAIDLAVDITCRFTEMGMPREFYQDFLKVAADEARHFTMLSERLRALGAKFGDYAVHGSLWESADSTKGDVLARLAVVHMVHEARGLDVNPMTIKKFSNAKDAESVTMLSHIHRDEVTHVATGQKWFSYICKRDGRDKYATFHELVRKHFYGLLKPPFNDADRLEAGLDPQYYLPLTRKPDEPADSTDASEATVPTEPRSRA
ncbi:hypothetical protein HK101_007006 [Irineochytrium annulatum]|nr:hypothetical protein HK101_007006 [Irineochytrium annulatum]